MVVCVRGYVVFNYRKPLTNMGSDGCLVFTMFHDVDIMIVGGHTRVKCVQTVIPVL